MMQYQDMVLDISYINNTSSNVNEITNKFTQPQHFTKNQKIALPKLYFNYCWQSRDSMGFEVFFVFGDEFKAWDEL